MYKLEQFMKEVKKNTLEETKKNNRIEEIEEIERNGGIENKDVKQADKYFCEKFMNYYISKKINYLNFMKEQGKDKNEKDYMQMMSNCVIVIYSCEGRVKFNNITFKAIADGVDQDMWKRDIKKVFKYVQDEKKLQLIYYVNKYVGENLRDCLNESDVEVKQEIDIKDTDGKTITYTKTNFKKLKLSDGIKSIIEQLKIHFL